MKKKRVYIFLAIASIAILAVIRNVQLKRAKAPEYVFTYAENQSEDYPTTKGALKFSELVWEKTSGRIKILVKSGAELGSENEVINQMQYGGIDFARVSIAIISDSIPEMNVLQMPYLYNDSEHTWNKLTAQDQKIIMECARLSAEYEHDLWQEEEKKAKQTAKEYGCVINELTLEEKKTFKAALSELYPKYCGKYRDIIDQIIQIGQNK